MRQAIERFKSSISSVLLHRHFYPACFAAALLVRLLFIALFHARPVSDFQWYYEKGLDIAAGDGYVVRDDGFPLWDPGKPLAAPKPTAFWPVGYPAFLGALFFATSWLVAPLLAAKVTNAVLYVAAIGAVAYSAKVIFSSDLAGRLTALILAFLPNHIAYTSLTSVEIYFVFLTTSATALLLLYDRSQRLVFVLLSGLLFGLATLTKPQVLLLPAALVLCLYWRRWQKALRIGPMLYACALLCVLPWSFRNYRVFDGRFVLVSNNGGINLLISNMPGSWGREGYMWNKELHEIIHTIDDELARDRAAKDAALSYATHNVGPLVRALPEKMLALYAADIDGFGWNQSADARYQNARFWLPLRVVSQLYYMPLVVLAIACIWRLRKNRGKYFWVGPTIVGYVTAICLVFTGGARFHFPMIPWFAAYTAGFLAAVLSTERAALPIRAPSASKAEVG